MSKHPTKTQVKAEFKSAFPTFEFEHGEFEVGQVYDHLKSNGELPKTAAKAARAIAEFIGSGS